MTILYHTQPELAWNPRLRGIKRAITNVWFRYQSRIGDRGTTRIPYPTTPHPSYADRSDSNRFTHSAGA
jgi:hypothetical protein